MLCDECGQWEEPTMWDIWENIAEQMRAGRTVFPLDASEVPFNG
jgi:hypothetical protein